MHWTRGMHKGRVRAPGPIQLILDATIDSHVFIGLGLLLLCDIPLHKTLAMVHVPCQQYQSLHTSLNPYSKH